MQILSASDAIIIRFPYKSLTNASLHLLSNPWISPESTWKWNLIFSCKHAGLTRLHPAPGQRCFNIHEAQNSCIFIISWDGIWNHHSSRSNPAVLRKIHIDSVLNDSMPRVHYLWSFQMKENRLFTNLTAVAVIEVGEAGKSLWCTQHHNVII